MSRHCVFPGLKHFAIILLLNSNASSILDFGELGGALFVHAVLKVSTHGAISFANLTKDVSLMRFLLVGSFESMLFMSTILSIDVGVDGGFVVVTEPILFFLHGLLEEDILLTVLIDVLEKVDTSLVLTAPLLLTSVPLVFVFFLSQLFYHALMSILIGFNVLIMGLELLDFGTSG